MSIQSYEEQRAAEKAQAAADLKRLKEIALLMNLTPDKDDEHGYAHLIARKGNMVLHFNAGGYNNKGRLRVGGSYPRDCKGSPTIYGSDNGPKDITISLNKSNEAIVKDIENRYLPSYNRTMELALQRVADVAKAQNDRRAVINELGRILGIVPADEGNGRDKANLSYWHMSEGGDVKSLNIETSYHAEEVCFEIRVNNEIAKSIAELLSLYVNGGV